MNTLVLSKENNYARNVLIILGAGLFLTLMGTVSIPLPFTPVPISFRFQTILFLSILLGQKRAILAVLVFLGLNAPLLLGPTAGYLVGYLFAASFVKPEKPVYSFLIGTLAVYICGWTYLSSLIGCQKAFFLGIVPFIIGDLMKSIICLNILKYVHVFRRN